MSKGKRSYTRTHPVLRVKNRNRHSKIYKHFWSISVSGLCKKQRDLIERQCYLDNLEGKARKLAIKWLNKICYLISIGVKHENLTITIESIPVGAATAFHINFFEEPE